MTATMTSREMREWRKTLGLTQREAAEALGVAPRTVRAWEGGEWPIPLSVAFACQWLGRAEHARSDGLLDQENQER